MDSMSETVDSMSETVDSKIVKLTSGCRNRDSGI